MLFRAQINFHFIKEYQLMLFRRAMDDFPIVLQKAALMDTNLVAPFTVRAASF